MNMAYTKFLFVTPVRDDETTRAKLRAAAGIVALPLRKSLIRVRRVRHRLTVIVHRSSGIVMRLMSPMICSRLMWMMCLSGNLPSRPGPVNRSPRRV